MLIAPLGAFCIIFVLLFVANAASVCPHQRSTEQKRWSDSATWGDGTLPGPGEDPIISDHVILDVPTVDCNDLTIAAGGSLVVDPEVDVSLRARNIFVYGSLEIGSEDCLHGGQVTITLTGTRADHGNATNPKVILVGDGGTLEMHGQKKLAWTKISHTVGPPTNDDVIFQHSLDATNNANLWTKGLVVYTFSTDDLLTAAKQFGVYDLPSQGNLFAQHLDDTVDGDIIMVMTQRYVRLDDGTRSKQGLAYDAVERLLYGEVTGTTTLRSVTDDGETYGLIYRKGDPSSFIESRQPLGAGNKVQYTWDQLVFTALTGSGPNFYYQQDDFIVQTLNSAFPKLLVIDDVQTWQPGDKVVIASTDFQWRQSEERTVHECNDCTEYEIRVDAPFKYTHYGVIERDAVDMRAEVALLSRNIVIQGDMEETCPSANGNCGHAYVKEKDTFGAHVKVLYGYQSVHIEGVELRYVGQQTDLGRYPVHFHMCLSPLGVTNPPYIREVSIHHTFARCVTIHASHGIEVSDSVCYDHMGHGFYLEDGGEQNNTFDGNLALGTRRSTGLLEPLDAIIPASFWITNPRTTLINNVAAGGDGDGFWILFPDHPLGPSADLDPPLMGELEARHTPMTRVFNNVAHSNSKVGFQLSQRLDDNRMITCCNKWQPKSDPENEESDNVEFVVSHITGYKNRNFNVWVQGGTINVTHVSASDSVNGIMVDNDQLIGKTAGRLMKSVIIGNSENLGEPLEGDIRSFPQYYARGAPRTGLSLWHGPIEFYDIWFDEFEPHVEYDIGAIGVKRPSPYFFPVVTELKGMLFAFDDDVSNTTGCGNIAIHGKFGENPGWVEGDIGHSFGYTWYADLGEGLRKYYVVPGDHFAAAAADCRLRTNWRMALCETKYGNIRLRFDDNGKNGGVVWVRDDLPSAQQDYIMEFATGPLVVLDGTRTYTLHFKDEIPEVIRIYSEGMDIGDRVRIGVCIPPEAEFNFATFTPHRAYKTEDFVRVNSLEELDADDENDGKKLFFDENSGMWYYKFITLTDREPGLDSTCPDNACPILKITIYGGSRKDADCRDRLYGDRVNLDKPSLPTFDDVIPATGSDNPPEGWGAGSTRPFSTRVVVDGVFSDWTEWTECSVTCAGGEQTRSRRCDNPAPANGGLSCVGATTETRACAEEACPVITGGFIQWSDWSSCVYPSSDCQGFSIRTRECADPFPLNGGEYCSGSMSDMKPCNTC